jgi:hypothetical protein
MCSVYSLRLIYIGDQNFTKERKKERKNKEKKKKKKKNEE